MSEPHQMGCRQEEPSEADMRKSGSRERLSVHSIRRTVTVRREHLDRSSCSGIFGQLLYTASADGRCC